ncbi:MAG: hypothetical protein ACOX0K_09405 [Oscillospiraceae bacterium]
MEADGCGDWCVGDLNPGLGLLPLADNKLAMPMLGYARPHKYCRGGEQKLGQPGFAVWTKGRLAALVADERGGFQTPKIKFEGKQIVLNVQTTPSGCVRMELRNEKGEAIEGYRFADCDAIVGDHIGHTVSWRGNTDLSVLSGQDIIMAFEMHSAKLFSFEFIQ